MKKPTTSILSIIILLSSFLSLSAQDIDSEISTLLASERENLPVEGELLYDYTDLSLYYCSSNNGATKVIVSAEEELPFEKKFHINVKKAGTNAWEPQFQTPKNDIPVLNGDMLFYVVYLKTTDTESPNDFGKTAFYSQRASSPWTTIGSMTIALNTRWRKFYITAKAEEDFDIDEMLGTFHLGFLQQELEIGGILALNLGQGIDINDLPVNTVAYDGMEPDADWRAEADARIEQVRKSNLSIKIVDKDNIPIEDANVTVHMKKHAYEFGTFMSDIALETSADGGKYREHVTNMFNNATTPFYMGGNDDNWGWYGSPTAKDDYPNLAAWLKSVNMPAKGHVLIWPSWQWMPSFFEDLKGDPDGLKAAIEEHLETLVPIGKENEIYQWDVVNEPFINHDVMDILGEDILVEWYNIVHDLDSVPELILNEYNILMGGGRADFQENFERLITNLKEQDTPLDGIGMQGHFDELLTGIPQVLEILDRFAKFDLPIQITEFDVSIRDEEVQAQYLEDFYTAVFSHPATEKIVMWGYYEKVMWKPLAALVRNDWTYKPNYDAYMDLIYDKWWTDDNSGVTNSEGVFSTRGFNGSYDITVSVEDSVYLLKDVLMEEDLDLQLMHGTPDIIDHSDNWDRIRELSLNVFPNPFTNSSSISYSLPSPESVELKIFNGQGQLVKSFYREHEMPGEFRFELDGNELNPGIYLCILDTKGSYAGISTIAVRN